jgi:hypothetical protein
MIVRSTALTAAMIIMLGCEPKQAEEQSDGETIASDATDAPGSNDDLLEACVLKMHSPEVREWKTYWDPRADGLVKQGPSSAGSPYWANEEERQKRLSSGISAIPPLSIDCSAEDQDGQTEIAISLGAYGSTEQQVPFGPGTYPVIGRFGGEKKPGAFVANLVFGEGLLDANGGAVNIERFDSEGVAGSFSVEAKELYGNNRTLQLEGTFDMPCRGGPLESKCTANKAIRE